MRADFTPSRLEAFSDGVIAIIITIMVLELKVPHTVSPEGLLKLSPIFLSYALSYAMVAIYWINHHHIFHFAKHVNSTILWANMMLLFFLSLVPFFTAYIGENYATSFAAALYAGIMMVCGLSFLLLRKAIEPQFDGDEKLRKWNTAAKHKNMIALGLYISAIFAAYINPGITFLLIVVVAIMYCVPDAWLRYIK